MENQLIEVENLKAGDEIMISCQSHFKYLKVLVPPRLSKTKKHWTTGQPLYGSARCSTRQDVVTHNYTGYNNQIYTRTEKKWMVTPEDHNIRISQDLNGRQIWLVKREQQWNKD